MLFLRVACLVLIAFTVSTRAAATAISEADSTDRQPRIPAVPQKSEQQDPQKSKKKAAAKNDTLRYTGQQVVVTGTRNEVLLKDSPVRVEVVDKKQTQSTAMATVGDLLKEQTGLVIAQGTVRTGIQMMGLGPDYTMILVDGQPLTGRVGGVLDLNRLSVGNIERVEIVKGPMSSLYGSEALAGVINIITRKPESGWGGKAYLQYLYHGAAETQVENTYANDDWDVATFLNVKKSQPFELKEDTTVYPYSGFTDYTLQTRAVWYARSGLKFSGNIRAFGSESRGKFLDGAAGFITSNEGSLQTTDRSATFGADWVHGKARLTAQLYGTVYNETYNFDVDQGGAGSTDDLRRRTMRSFLQYDVLWNLKNRLTFGGEFLYDDIKGTRYKESPLYRTNAFFIQWEGYPTDWVSYALSLRYDKNSAFDVPTSFFLEKVGVGGVPLLPRLSLTLKPTDNIRLYATAGEGFKAPDFRQLYVQFSNRLPGAGYDLIGARILGINLLPEQSHSYDIGAFIQLNDSSLTAQGVQLALDVRAYRNNLRNLIEFYPYSTTPVVYSYRNVNRVFTQGIECSAQFRLIVQKHYHISGNVGYQYLDARNARIAEGIDSGKVVYFRPSTGEFIPIKAADYGGLWYRSHHTAVGRLQVDEDEWGMTANLRAQYVGAFGEEQLDNNPNAYINGGESLGAILDREDEYVQGYWNLNATLTKRFSWEAISNRSVVQVSVGVNNLLNKQNLRFIPNLMGRQFFINASLTW